MKKINPYATYGEIRKTLDKMEWEKARGPEYWEYRRKWEERPKKWIQAIFQCILTSKPQMRAT